MPVRISLGSVIRRVSNAFVGIDHSGDARGAGALDIQTERSASSMVASGQDAVVLGQNNTGAGLNAVIVGGSNSVDGSSDDCVIVGTSNDVQSGFSVVVGKSNTVTGGSQVVSVGNSQVMGGTSSVAVGNTAGVTTGTGGTALGNNASVQASRSVALGNGAIARLADSFNVSGVPIIRKDAGESVPIQSWSGMPALIFSAEKDLKTTFDVTVTLPAGCKFWLDEVGIVCTALDTLATQPTIRFGIVGTLAKHYVAAITTQLTAVGKRETVVPLVPQDGETTLSAGVTIAASATTCKGRFYWKGIYVEDE